MPLLPPSHSTAVFASEFGSRLWAARDFVASKTVVTACDAQSMSASCSARNFSPLVPKTEITSSCKTKEVAASPSANETILAVEEEAVDEDKEVDDAHILLLLVLQDSAFSVLGTLGLSFSRTLGSASPGNTIRCAGTGEGTKTSAW